jgi:hypothetical protein
MLKNGLSASPLLLVFSSSQTALPRESTAPATTASAKTPSSLGEEGRDPQEEKMEEKEEEEEEEPVAGDGNGGSGTAAGVALASGGSPRVALACLGENKMA